MTDPSAFNRFFDQTGGRGCRVWAVTRDDPQPVEFAFVRPYMIIGNSSRCDVRLQHPEVSFRHTYLQWVNGKLACFDLGSRTGTLRRRDVGQKVWLQVNEWFGVGPYFVRVENPRDTETVLTQPPDPVQCRLEVMSPTPATAKERWQSLKQPVVLLGWGECCDLRLKHKSVSQAHASLVVTEFGVWVVNLLGRTPPLLNGNPIDCQFAQHNDWLTIGDFEFRVDYQILPRSLPAPKLDLPADVPVNRELPRPTGTALIRAKPSRDLPPLDSLKPQPAKDVSSQELILLDALQQPQQEANPESRDRTSTGTAWTRPEAQGKPEQTVDSDHRFETLVTAIVREFSQMQQEMYSQNRQMMQMMAEMMDSVHREQREFVQKEFREIQKISVELQTVRSELAQEIERSETATQAAKQSPDEAKSSAYTSHDESSTSDSHSDLQFEPESKAEYSETASRAEENESGSNAGASPPHQDSASSGKRAYERTPEEEEAKSARASTGQERFERQAWLNERLQKLERERSSKWRKLMRALKGGKS